MFYDLSLPNFSEGVRKLSLTLPRDPRAPVVKMPYHFLICALPPSLLYWLLRFNHNGRSLPCSKSIFSSHP